MNCEATKPDVAAEDEATAVLLAAELLEVVAGVAELVLVLEAALELAAEACELPDLLEDAVLDRLEVADDEVCCVVLVGVLPVSLPDSRI